MEKEKKYTFGEKEKEYINGKTIPVELHTPKYKEAKAKIIKLLESEEYKDVLEKIGERVKNVGSFGYFIIKRGKENG